MTVYKEAKYIFI